jgi:nicotinate-nucleotide adenylyltransferase
MRIALFGGSFDPPHVGHQMACLYVLSTYDVDALWMVPCFRHPFDKRIESFAHRAAMCRAVAEPLGPRVRVSDIEEELGGPSFTLTTVQALSARHPEHEFFLVIGADLLRERERWYGAEELLATVRFIILGRAGLESGIGASELRPGRDLHHADSLELPAVSSTQVRAQLSAGEEPAGLLCRSVLAYIRQHNLYKEGSSAGRAGPEPNQEQDQDPGQGSKHVAV